MDQLLQNLKVAARSLLRQRAFSLAAVVTLALGIGASTAIFSVVYGILLRPLPYPESERLVTLGQTARDNPHRAGGRLELARELPRLEARVEDRGGDGHVQRLQLRHYQPR